MALMKMYYVVIKYEQILYYEVLLKFEFKENQQWKCLNI